MGRLLSFFACAVLACSPFSVSSGGGGGGYAPPDACCPDDGSWCTRSAVPHGCSDSWPAICGPKMTCDSGWADCDGDSTNGCEADLGSADHCGACGLAVDTCPPPHAAPLYPSGFQAEGVAVDTTHVYWMSDGVLSAAPKDGGGPVAVLASGESSWDAGLVLSNDHVYWPWMTGAIHRVAIGGGSVEVLRSGMGQLVSNMVVYGDVAYVVVARGNDGELVDTTGRELLATSGASAAIALFGSVIFVADYQGIRSIRVDGTDVESVPAIGSPIATSATTIYADSGTNLYALVYGEPAPKVLRADGDLSFKGAAASSDGTLYVAGEATPPASESACFDLERTAFIASIDGATGHLRVIDRPDVAAGGLYGSGWFSDGAPSRVAVDDAFVYWVTFGGGSPGSVFRAPR